MNYIRVYWRIIHNRLHNKVDGYVERHHIIPRSEGGPDNNDNIVALTAREHYICHLLLAKIYNDYKMLSAVVFMQCKSHSHKRDFKFNSRLYAKMRKDFSKKTRGIQKSDIAKQHMSENHADVNGENNPMFGKDFQQFMTPEAIQKRKQKCSKARKGKTIITNGVIRKMWSKDVELPNGWSFYKADHSYNPGSNGMYWWNNGIEMRLIKECPGPEWKRGRIKKKNPGT